jgi:hypothetical protein
MVVHLWITSSFSNGHSQSSISAYQTFLDVPVFPSRTLQICLAVCFFHKALVSLPSWNGIVEPGNHNHQKETERNHIKDNLYQRSIRIGGVCFHVAYRIVNHRLDYWNKGKVEEHSNQEHNEIYNRNLALHIPLPFPQELDIF